MELILNAAKEKLSGQYVFLTPQEMGFEYFFLPITIKFSF